MHVSGHFKSSALQAGTTTKARGTGNMPVNPEEITPVEARFAEDEREAERRRQPNWQREFRQPQDQGDPSESADVLAEHRTPQASVAVQAAPQAASRLGSLLAGITNEAPMPSEPTVSGRDPKAAAEASLDDLLALMRAAPEQR